MKIIHAKLFPMDSPMIPDGYLAVEDGKITGIGPMSDPCLEDFGEEIDAGGAFLYPGFIDAHTHLGLWEDGLGFEGEDGNESTDPSTPHLRALDGLNPFDRCFSEAAEAGITTVLTGPGSANPIGGQMVALKTREAPLDDRIVREPCAMKFALGENPKMTYSEKSHTPVTRMATAAIIREQLFLADRYRRDKRAAAGGDGDEPEFDMKCEALIPVLEGACPVHFHAHRADDIATAIRIAEEFALHYVIVHATEGHLIAEWMKEKGARVLAGPLLCDRSKPEMRNLTPASAGKMQEAGLPLAIVTDHPVIPVQYLTLCAALAVREGLDREAALRAITIEAAKICGIEDRVGSLTKGKDADFVLFDGDLLEFSRKPRAVYIDGKQVR